MYDDKDEDDLGHTFEQGIACCLYTQASRSTASRSTDFQIAVFLIGSKSPPTALFLVIFTMTNL